MITAVVGGSFGSEGKGLVVGHIAGDYGVHVRVGAANAGHTVYVRGEKHVLQQLPVAAYANPTAKLVLGAGALISGEILLTEIVRNVEWRRCNKLPPLDLRIDHRAHVIQPHHIQQEQDSDLAARIGSTSTIAQEGIGAAQAARVLRTGYQTMRQAWEDGFCNVLDEYVELVDSVQNLHYANGMGMDILLEGTQGTGLDNVLGLEYPYVTSRHVTASGLAADVGLGPRDIDRVIVVCRTYPIRVAGNSGPFWPDSREIGWEEIGVDPESERTTVTKKVRRVATFSYNQLLYACQVNSATDIALNFADYLCPELKGRGGAMRINQLQSYDYIGPMIRNLERLTAVPVSFVGTGPDTVIERVR